MWFKPENTVEYAFNFGCGIFTGPAPDSNPISLFSNFMNAKKPAQNDDDEGEENSKEPLLKEKEDKWEMFRSFFLAIHGKTQIEFQTSSLFNNQDFLQGKFKNFDFTIKELKVFKGQDNNEREMTSEEQFYIDSLNNMKSFINNTPISKWASTLPIL